MLVMLYRTSFSTLDRRMMLLLGMGKGVTSSATPWWSKDVYISVGWRRSRSDKDPRKLLTMLSLTLLVLGSLVARLSIATPTMELEVRSDALDGKYDDLSIDAVKARYDNGTLDLEKREVGPTCTNALYLATSPTDSTRGDGDPNQNYLDVQVSDNIACTDGGCSVGQESSQSVTIGFSFGTNSNFKPTFFQGGFSVSESWETGNDYTCDGEAGETICIWQRVAHTAVSLTPDATASLMHCSTASRQSRAARSQAPRS